MLETFTMKHVLMLETFTMKHVLMLETFTMKHVLMLETFTMKHARKDTRSDVLETSRTAVSRQRYNWEKMNCYLVRSTNISVVGPNSQHKLYNRDFCHLGAYRWLASFLLACTDTVISSIRFLLLVTVLLCLRFELEDRGNMFFRNVSRLLLDYTVKHRRR
jgi:hypothetical protein